MIKIMRSYCNSDWLGLEDFWIWNLSFFSFWQLLQKRATVISAFVVMVVWISSVVRSVLYSCYNLNFVLFMLLFFLNLDWYQLHLDAYKFATVFFFLLLPFHMYIKMYFKEISNNAFGEAWKAWIGSEGATYLKELFAIN